MCVCVCVCVCVFVCACVRVCHTYRMHADWGRAAPSHAAFAAWAMCVDTAADAMRVTKVLQKQALAQADRQPLNILLAHAQTVTDLGRSEDEASTLLRWWREEAGLFCMKLASLPSQFRHLSFALGSAAATAPGIFFRYAFAPASSNESRTAAAGADESRAAAATNLRWMASADAQQLLRDASLRAQASAAQHKHASDLLSAARRQCTLKHNDQDRALRSSVYENIAKANDAVFYAEQTEAEREQVQRTARHVLQDDQRRVVALEALSAWQAANPRGAEADTSGGSDGGARTDARTGVRAGASQRREPYTTGSVSGTSLITLGVKTPSAGSKHGAAGVDGRQAAENSAAAGSKPRCRSRHKGDAQSRVGRRPSSPTPDAHQRSQRLLPSRADAQPRVQVRPRAVAPTPGANSRADFGAATRADFGPATRADLGGRGCQSRRAS